MTDLLTRYLEEVMFTAEVSKEPNVAMLTPEQVDPSSWRYLLDHAPAATPFHGLGWIRAINETYPSMDARVLVFDDERGYMGGFPYAVQKKYGPLKFLVSLPLGTYGGPVLRDDAPREVYHALWDSFQEIAQKKSIIAVTATDFLGHKGLEPPSGYSPRPRFTHVIPLETDYNNVERKMYAPDIRKNIRRAAKKDVRVERVTTEAGVEEYARIARHTLMRHGTKPYPDELFLNIFRQMGDDCLYHLARHEGQVVAGSLHFAQGNSVMNWLTPSYSDFWNLHPNHALIDQMVRWAVEHGKKWYNFGGSPEEDLNLINFKERWGAKRYNYRVWEWDSGLFGSIRRLRSWRSMDGSENIGEVSLQSLLEEEPVELQGPASPAPMELKTLANAKPRSNPHRS